MAEDSGYFGTMRDIYYILRNLYELKLRYYGKDVIKSLMVSTLKYIPNKWEVNIIGMAGNCSIC